MIAKVKQKLKTIRDNINSDDLDILKQSMSIIDWLLKRENERGKSAVMRVNILLTLSGAASAVILFFVKMFLELSSYNYPLIIYSIFSTATLFLIIAIYYLIRALKPTKRFQLTPEVIAEIQGKNFKESLRFEIKWKIWEYFQMQSFNSKRLFYLDKGQINVLFGMIFFLLLGIMIFINERVLSVMPKEVDYIISLVTLLSVYFCNTIMNRFGIWNFE